MYSTGIEMRSLIYSHTEGKVAMARFKEVIGDSAYAILGISFPLPNYRLELGAGENYISWEVLKPMLEITELIEERLKVGRANVCYGSSVQILKENKRIKAFHLHRERLDENSDVSLEELSEICKELNKFHSIVTFLKEQDVYLSAQKPYNPLSRSVGIRMDILDIATPKQTLGCRVELYLPEEDFEVERIGEKFDVIAEYAKFGRSLYELENIHEEFLKLKEKCRKRPKVVRKVKV